MAMATADATAAVQVLSHFLMSRLMICFFCFLHCLGSFNCLLAFTDFNAAALWGCSTTTASSSNVFNSSHRMSIACIGNGANTKDAFIFLPSFLLLDCSTSSGSRMFLLCTWDYNLIVLFSFPWYSSMLVPVGQTITHLDWQVLIKLILWCQM